MKTMFDALRASLLLLGLLACGGERLEPPAPPQLFPLAVGNAWTYRVTEADGAVIEKVQTVTGTTSEGGAAAFTLVSVRGNRQTRSVQRVDEAGRLVRLREEGSEDSDTRDRFRFMPFALRVDTSRTRLQDSYESAHVEERLGADGGVLERTDKSYRFVVEAVDDRVVVPAGEFSAVRVRRESGSGAVKTYWYAFGVGKVKESGGQTEELSAYRVQEP
jgi:hypothetical protein